MANVTIQRAWTDLASKVKGALAGGAAAGVASVAGVDTLLLWLWNTVLHGAWAAIPIMPDNIASIIVTLIGVLAGGWITKDSLPAGTVAATLPGTGQLVGDVKTPAVQAKESTT